MADKLGACPFCGGASAVESDEYEWDSSRVICRDCGATGPYAYHPDHHTVADAEKAAIDLWHTRALPPADVSAYRWVPIEQVGYGLGEMLGWAKGGGYEVIRRHSDGHTYAGAFTADWITHVRPLPTPPVAPADGGGE